MHALTRRHVALLVAKRAVETMVETGEAHVTVPMMEDAAVFAGDLLAAGIRVKRVAEALVDVRSLRRHLNLTQEQFALRYAIDLATLRNWEQGRYRPEAAAAAYLRVIAQYPAAAAEAQEAELS